jgi:periplasmic protein CpxP/Spy
MKRMASLMVVLMLFMTAALAQGKGRPGHMGGVGGPGEGHNFLGGIARHLDLTEAQKAQAKEILEAERAIMQPVFEQMRENREALRAATEGGQFSEAEVTRLAQIHGELSAQMIVSRERVQAQLWQILTPEQREKAEELKQQFQERKGPRGAKKNRSGN